MDVTRLADLLRAAGLIVVEHPGWETRGNGDLASVDAVIWHHDGSPIGASPNVPSYIAGQVDADKAGANIWVGLDGTWNLIAARMTFHAGAVLDGKPGNKTSLGIETDHTTGEVWSGVELLASLRRGTAAILNHLMRSPAIGLEFHKTVCKPVGRKNDPDGLDISTERAAVALLMSEGDDVPAPTDVTGSLQTPTKKGRWLLTYDGGIRTEGDAKFYGSVPGLQPEQRMGVGGFYVIEPFGAGYALTDTKGNTYRFKAA